MLINKKNVSATYLRNFVFGVEDSLVSTVGLLSGVATAEVSSNTIFIIGIVLIFVEAVSMAAGSFLSEYSAEEYESRREVSPKKSLLSGIVMFFSYFISGFIPLSPYIFLNIKTAFWASIFLSLISLFLLGVLRAKISNIRALHHGLQMSAVGGIAILVGVIIGNIVH